MHNQDVCLLRYLTNEILRVQRAFSRFAKAISYTPIMRGEQWEARSLFNKIVWADAKKVGLLQ